MERSLTLVALFAALIAILGLVPAVTLSFGVPITAQSLGVMLCGTVLGAKRGGLAALLFIALVAAGLPLLAGGRGGIASFTTHPAAGFAIGFPFAAFVTGLITERTRALPLGLSAGLGAVLGGIVTLYAFGITGMSIILGKTWLEAAALNLAFVPGDLIKAVLAGFVTVTLAKMRPGAVLTRG